MKRLAVLGHPVAHSRSPAMQNAALAQLGLADEWAYEAIDVAPDDFETRVRAMPDEGFLGANVTIPHKEAALQLADEASPAAAAIGAANTLSFAAGRIRADNTDAGGLLSAVADLPASPRGIRALVLGAGGAARAAIWALSRGGAVASVDLEPRAVDAWNRTAERAAKLYDELGEHLDLGGVAVDAPRQEDYGIVVNTTSVGLHGEDPFEYLPLDPTKFRGQVVVDMVYGDGPTKLVEAAKDNGATDIDGIEILVRQGARSLEIWTGHEAPLGVMRTAAREGLSR
ncbi:MAG: shikimate dehydrogenase [Solirubrobacterales bacterium]